MFCKTLSIFLVVYFLLDFTYGTTYFQNDYSYIESLESYYKFHITPKNWRYAKTVCAQEGGSLFYPENSNEANTVISFWKQYQNSSQPDDTWLFVGISDIITEGVYETIDGKSISSVYNNWKLGQPDNSGDEDCVHLNQKGYINDVKCDAEYSFICKKNPASKQDCNCEIKESEESKYCQKDKKFFREDYTYIESEESFYKVHTTGQTFANAKQICAQEQASLYYAENADEVIAVAAFWNRTQPGIPWVFVGLTDERVEGVFETIDGRPISEVYSNWQSYQPDNSGGNEDCVHMDLAGTMNDYMCDSYANFICKKSLQSVYSDHNCYTPPSDCQKDNKVFREDYTYIESEESFYKVHTTGQTFADAKQICAQEQASLYYAENADEVIAVAAFWNRTQPGIPWVFVGLTDERVEGVFETIDGRPISEVYSNWQSYQPDNSGGNEDCVHMDLAGTMNDYICDSYANFICKKSLHSVQLDHNCDMHHSGCPRDEKFFRKDYTYIESEDSFYKVHTTARTFADAKQMCAQEQASLYYAENVDEVKAVASYWQGIQPAIPWVFVGLTDELTEGFFETIDGRPISEVYSNWQRFQPDNSGGNEDCVHMDLAGTMNDYICDSNANFICKKSRKSVQWNYKCNMPNSDYTYNQDNGKCYKVHTTPLNWADAYAMCRIEYTSLAVISNRVDADYLANLSNSTLKPRLTEQYYRGLYHLGFHNRFKKGWQTVDGTPLNVDGDAWFDNYQPDGNHNEECGSMFFNGNLINIDCNTKSLFICEHKVNCSSSTT